MKPSFRPLSTLSAAALIFTQPALRSRLMSIARGGLVSFSKRLPSQLKKPALCVGIALCAGLFVLALPSLDFHIHRAASFFTAPDSKPVVYAAPVNIMSGDQWRSLIEKVNQQLASDKDAPALAPSWIGSSESWRNRLSSASGLGQPVMGIDLIEMSRLKQGAQRWRERSVAAQASPSGALLAQAAADQRAAALMFKLAREGKSMAEAFEAALRESRAANLAEPGSAKADPSLALLEALIASAKPVYASQIGSFDLIKAPLSPSAVSPSSWALYQVTDSIFNAVNNLFVILFVLLGLCAAALLIIFAVNLIKSSAQYAVEKAKQKTKSCQQAIFSAWEAQQISANAKKGSNPRRRDRL